MCELILSAEPLFLPHATDHADLSQRFAGLTFGIANTAATIPGMIAGPLTAWILGGDTSREAPWQVVFGTAAAINVVGATVYWFFSDASRLF